MLLRKFLWIVFFAFSSLAAQDEGREYMVLPEGTVHQGDFFAAGEVIEISGKVEGDVYAMGSQILVDGLVTGSVIAMGGTVEISGKVEGSARLMGGQVEINGQIGRNVTILAGNIQIVAQASIGKNAVLSGGIIDISGDIGEDLTMSATMARLLGNIGRNVDAYVGQMRIGSRADIKGNLVYRSSQEAHIDDGAAIEGQVVFKRSVITRIFGGEWKRGWIFGTRFIGLFMNFIYSFVIGILLLKLFPQRLQRALKTLKVKPWKSFWLGVAVVILLPLACLVLFITILGFPLAIALVAFTLLGFYAAKIIPILLITNKFFHKIKWKENSLWGLAIGLILFFVFVQIPYLGAALSAIFTFLGLGAITLGRIRQKSA